MDSEIYPMARAKRMRRRVHHLRGEQIDRGNEQPIFERSSGPHTQLRPSFKIRKELPQVELGYAFHRPVLDVRLDRGEV